MGGGSDVFQRLRGATVGRSRSPPQNCWLLHQGGTLRSFAPGGEVVSPALLSVQFSVGEVADVDGERLFSVRRPLRDT